MRLKSGFYFEMHDVWTRGVLLSRPVKTPLKVQNGAPEAESPIKKVAKRSRQILDSDEDEAPVVKERVADKGQGDKDASTKTEKVRKRTKHLTLNISQFLAAAKKKQMKFHAFQIVWKKHSCLTFI